MELKPIVRMYENANSQETELLLDRALDCIDVDGDQELPIFTECCWKALQATITQSGVPISLSYTGDQIAMPYDMTFGLSGWFFDYLEGLCSEDMLGILQCEFQMQMLEYFHTSQIFLTNSECLKNEVLHSEIAAHLESAKKYPLSTINPPGAHAQQAVRSCTACFFICSVAEHHQLCMAL